MLERAEEAASAAVASFLAFRFAFGASLSSAAVFRDPSPKELAFAEMEELSALLSRVVFGFFLRFCFVESSQRSIGAPSPASALFRFFAFLGAALPATSAHLSPSTSSSNTPLPSRFLLPPTFLASGASLSSFKALSASGPSPRKSKYRGRLHSTL